MAQPEVRNARRLSWRWLPNTITYLAAAVMLGMGDIINGQFSLRNFTQSDFYSDLGLFYGAVIMVLFSTIDIYITKFKKNDERYLELKKGIEYFLDNEMEGDFTFFLEEEVNIPRAEKEYRAIVQEMIDKLNGQKTFFRRKFVWVPADKILWFKGTEDEKKANLYCVQRQELEDLLTPEATEIAIRYSNFTYDKLAESWVKTGTTKKKKTIHAITVESSGKKMARDIGPRLLLGFGWTMFITSLIFSPQAFDRVAMYKTVIKVLFMSYQFGYAIHYAMNVFGPEKITDDAQNRRDIFLIYTEWKVKLKEAK